MASVVDSQAVTPRKRKRLKEGESHQIHFELPADMIKLIDQVADQAGGLQRTAAIKVLISEALRQRGLLK